MIHYHGTPITPRSVLLELHGCHFCVSFSAPQDVEPAHSVGQSIMLDNGAFSFWRRNPLRNTPQDWQTFYDWAKHWLAYKTSWAVIPDVIDGSEQENDRLIAEWFVKMGSYKQAAPVWHIHENFDRLEKLVSLHERVCFGSSGQYSTIGDDKWNNRVNEAFNRICKGSGACPAWIHMLRGMSLAGSCYPFSSVDSTDVARNHHRQGNARQMAAAWDAVQCQALWTMRPIQSEMSMQK
jgi:hypothetical protein